MTKKNAIIYCRVSSPKQQEEGSSLENQEKVCKKYCKNLNIEVIKIFAEAFTGNTSNRPEFEKALHEAIKKNVEYFVIFDIDRFSREGYEEYKRLKNELQVNNIKLKDSKNIIGERELVVHNDIFDMGKYDWAHETSSEYAEIFLATQASSEGRKIKQRTIPREIELEQMGYKVRQSNFGFLNKKISILNGKKATIQIKDHIEGEWIIEMFENRAKGIITDEKIVEQLNLKGFVSRRGKKLNVKQLQAFIKRPIYAGLVVGEWTRHKAIKAPYEGLISIEVWNKANKGKKRIIELENGDIEIVEGNQNNQKIKRRKKFNPNLPFRNLVLSSAIPGKFISGSYSNPSRNNPTSYYHPVRTEKTRGKKCENITKEDFESMIFSIFDDIQINDIIKIIFEDRFDKIFEMNKDKVSKDIDTYNLQLKRVQKDLNTQEEKICNIDSSLQGVLKIIEKKLLSLEDEKREILEKIEKHKSSGYNDPENFKKFCFYTIEHLSELLIQSESHEELSTLFKFVFKKTPTRNEINNRTFEIYPIFALNSKKESSIIENSSENLKWHLHLESNQEHRIWNPGF